MRMPKGVSPAAGRPAAGLPCSQQHKMKLLSTGGVKTEFFSTGLSSPPMSTVPAGYFTQICNTTVAEQRANSLYSTPHGPEAKPIRSSSGRLPVQNQTHTPQSSTVSYGCMWAEQCSISIGMHLCHIQMCFDAISHRGASVSAAGVPSFLCDGCAAVAGQDQAVWAPQ